MKRSRKEQRAALEAKRAALKAKVASRPKPVPRKRPKKKDKPPRRWPWLLLLLILLLLSLCCGPFRCAEPPEGEGEVPAEVEPGPAEEIEAPIVLPDHRLGRRDRPSFDAGPPDPPAWIAAFRMQVAARAPRLADCFVGVARPGRLKWTCSVEAESGAVSDHELEPMLMTDALTRTERACVLEALSDPPYHLDVRDAPSTPPRVGIVIEF